MFINFQVFEIILLFFLAVLLVSPILATILLCIVFGVDGMLALLIGEVLALIIVLTVTISTFIEWMLGGIRIPATGKQNSRA